MSPGDWELRALTIAARLSDAADELRDLITNYRDPTHAASDEHVPDEQGRLKSDE